ncbi:MAG: hypothetical protein A3E83_05085 [Gammaproteobacteria bacterium RIFCSPHIGHO2_12_FULL_41_20]|nr:MAG: hypothetical protein A3E83_05085 [Gammaproteobacteria bacterium RIFCSPHIGHO2_12_FULL_41_20]
MKVIPRSQHNISRQAINPNALKVLYRLHHAGYAAYLVGGCVRDLLLGRHPKDFDIATDAHPEQIRALFRNCLLIGRRFRLAHIRFGKEVIEVATFRAPHNIEHTHKEGMVLRDNVYGTIKDDAWRRDFTINALYYNIADFSVVDYMNGMEDLQAARLRIIGDPEQRYQEDPVRILRAARLAGKLHFTLSPETASPIRKLSSLLQHVSTARLYQEVVKFFQEGKSLPIFKLLQEYALFQQLFPQVAPYINNPLMLAFLEKILAEADQRIAADKNISPAFLLAAFLWHPIFQQIQQLEEQGEECYFAYQKSIRHVLLKQRETLALPRYIQATIHDICILQYRMDKQGEPFSKGVLRHPRYRAAYDLWVIRKHHHPLELDER